MVEMHQVFLVGELLAVACREAHLFLEQTYRGVGLFIVR